MLSSSPPLLSGIASWPWFGRFLWDPLPSITDAQRRYGPYCILDSPLSAIHRGRRYVMAIGASYNREILGHPEIFRTGGQVLRGPKGSAQHRIRHGILAMYGEQHRVQRRIMQPPFQKSAVAANVPIMADLIDQILGQWRPGETLDMYRQMRVLSNWLAAKILFGNEDFAASIRLGQTIERWFTLDARARNTFFWLNMPGTTYRRLLRQAENLEADMLETIKENRRTKIPGSDVLSILIRALDSQQAGMTETDLVAHGVILYGASFETTANALAWALFLIAQHPSVAADLHDEIVDRLNCWPPTSQELDALPLLDSVVRETLRLTPPVAFSYRTPIHDVELGGFALRGGDKILLSHYHTHRIADVFPEPNRFKPSRWFSVRPDPYEYIPFSAGPRLCLGYSFALTELKLAIARVMQRFRINAVRHTRIDGVVSLTLRPRDGIPMTVYTQDRKFAAIPVKGNVHRMVDLPK
jgi:cytochrome P450